MNNYNNFKNNKQKKKVKFKSLKTHIIKNHKKINN